ncbi:hypothetical protein AtDm6_0535 [Acetobacter tropicalis]|nr:hypothetical protein AtDm6_0535 [Acetobacter tropicalis]
MEAEYKGLSLSLQPDKGHRGLFAIYGFCGVAASKRANRAGNAEFGGF